MSSFKILHVAETATGGLGAYIDDVAALQIAANPHDGVRVVAPDVHAILFRRTPVVAQRRFKAANNRLIATWRMTVAALREIWVWQPDVVHLHSTFAGFALRPLLALLPTRPRVVYCSHGWAFDREGSHVANLMIKWVERLWSRWSDRVVCVSAHEFTAGERIGIPHDRLALVFNGVHDLGPRAEVSAAMRAWPEGQRRVLFVGRLDRQKGVDVLFEAMRQVQGEAFAVVVGASVVSRDSITEQPPNMQFTGWLSRDAISAYYAAAEVVVIPSRWEAFSLVAVEAMRAGRAVLGSAVGGLRDVIADGVTGRLLPPEDPVALAEALRSLDTAAMIRLGDAGRERYERNFRIERVAKELDAIYSDVLAEADPARTTSGSFDI